MSARAAHVRRRTRETNAPMSESLIINSPYHEPTSHWEYVSETRSFARRAGRRPAGYRVASPNARTLEDPGVLREIALVNAIRPRVRAWREGGYVGATGVTKRLLAHWNDAESRPADRRFFWCQLEAIETLIWLTEAPEAEKVGVNVPSDGGPFRRICTKMATGTGKTIVMAMTLAWQITNKATYPQDARFSKNALIVAPGLTVRRRLEAALTPSAAANYYEKFHIVPPGLSDRLRQGKVVIRNWHMLNWESDERIAKRRGVDKRGPKSDEAYARDALGEMATARNFVVINDEAHHAWRTPAGAKPTGISKEAIEEATKWIGGLDRLHAARGVLTAYDFSATPFAPSGGKNAEEDLFDWVVSDFGLNDAIESGLVKTPRVVVRDDGRYTKDYKSQFYHIYNTPEVKESLNRSGARESEPLPTLVTVAYELLGADWRETARQWKADGAAVPPVLISVANRTETAARIKYAFDHERVAVRELCARDRTLHIDSKVLEMAESAAEPTSAETDADGASRKLTKKEEAESLRRMVDTIGQSGQPGERIQHVISVGMLSEGWDAQTVTHIMGLRAFSSQLLCEQVVGRGLRRTAYDTLNPETGLFTAEYVNIFGVPFTFLPHETTAHTPPPPQSAHARIEAAPERSEFAIAFPNVLRIEHSYRRILTLDVAAAEPLEIRASDTPRIAQLAPILDGRIDRSRMSEIDLADLDRAERLQRTIFTATAQVFDQLQDAWRGDRNNLFKQLVPLVERFVNSDKLVVDPPIYGLDERIRRILIRFHIGKIVNHVVKLVKESNAESTSLVLDAERAIRSTADMQTWRTSRPVEPTLRSHVTLCVCDSAQEGHAVLHLDRSPHVAAWVKNDHVGFEIHYFYNGAPHRYRPDFLIRLVNRTLLILETKGRETDRDRAKRDALKEWTECVSADGRFGRWTYGVARNPDDIPQLLAEAMQRTAPGAA
jgi:type III restriction enzyme